MLRTLLAAFLFLYTSLASAADNADAQAQATTAAKAWLAMVDKGAYAVSWEASATPMRASVTPEEWERAMKGVRAPLGAVKARRLASAVYSTTLPGAPDGEYVVLTFRTRFANKRRAIETVTPLKDTDGKWHVGGYFIK